MKVKHLVFALILVALMVATVAPLVSAGDEEGDPELVCKTRIMEGYYWYLSGCLVEYANGVPAGTPVAYYHTIVCGVKYHQIWGGLYYGKFMADWNVGCR